MIIKIFVKVWFSHDLNNIKVLSSISGKDIIKYFKNDTQYYAKFLNKDGTPLKKTMVEFNIYGVFYKRKTNDEGIVKLNINLNPGEYIITAINPINNEMHSNTIKILPKIIGENVNMKYKDGSQYKVKLVDNIGKPVKGAGIDLNIYGVFYRRTTDSQGIARLNINLMPGQYIITASYKESATSNTITIKGI